MAFTHAPYVGNTRPFSISLKPIEPSLWIAPDHLLLPELTLKRDLLAHRRAIVVRERADTRAAQDEMLGLLVDHLTKRHPTLYSLAGSTMTIAGAETADLADPTEPPVVRAARLVQDDLVLMRRDRDSWRLVAACLCFPSNWSLAEKFDLPMDAIHAAVPGYAGQMSDRVNRIFDYLPQDQVVERFNWSIHEDDRLHHPPSGAAHRWWQESGKSPLDSAFVRVERQTLRRLPVSQDIIFTIRIYIDPVAAFRGHPDGKALARGLSEQLAGLNADQLAYKNLLAGRDRLLAALSELAG